MKAHEEEAKKKRKEVPQMKPILIVEDEAIVREGLKDWLAEGGYLVETAEEGEEALRKIAEKDFGVVILDLRLPGKDGLEVLREAKTQRPQLKGIIITAYPTVDTAVEAMKLGAVEYLPKPVAPDALERLIQETLGPIQVEIRPPAPAEAPPKEAPVAKAKIEVAIPKTEAEIPIYLKQGKEHLEAGRYQEALRAFGGILQVAPEHIETRIWIRKVHEAQAAPPVTAEGGAAAGGAVKPKECLWMRMGVVGFRLCTRNYDCLTCEFDQEMQVKMAAGEAPELEAALERVREQPGVQRLCRYALKGDVTHRLCTRVFQCATCEFGQMMEDALVQRLEKLAARREALRKKEQKAEATA